MADSKLEVNYDVDHVTLEQVTSEVERLWRQLLDSDSEIRKRALEAGCDASALSGPLSEHLEIRPIGARAGVGAWELCITVLGSHAAAKVGKDVWSYVLLPMLRRKFGDKAIAEKKSPSK